MFLIAYNTYFATNQPKALKNTPLQITPYYLMSLHPRKARSLMVLDWHFTFMDNDWYEQKTFYIKYNQLAIWIHEYLNFELNKSLWKRLNLFIFISYRSKTKEMGDMHSINVTVWFTSIKDTLWTCNVIAITKKTKLENTKGKWQETKKELLCNDNIHSSFNG